MTKKILFMLAAIIITVSTLVYPTTRDLLEVGLKPVTQLIDKVSIGVVEKFDFLKPGKPNESGLEPEATVEATFPPITDAIEVPQATEVPPVTDGAPIPDENSTAATPHVTVDKGKGDLPIYKLHWKSPVYTTNFAHPDEGCQWQGIAGQVLDSKGKPVSGLIVRVTGLWMNEWEKFTAVSGAPEFSAYGPGGYEIFLGNEPLDSTQELRIQVFAAGNLAQTYRFTFDTFSDCERNLIIFNFRQR